MDKINYRIILDAHKGGTQKVLRGFFTGDVAARTIAVSINASGVSCKFGAGTTAIMYVTKENGVTNYGECEVVDNTVYYNVLQADTDCSGIVEMQLKVLNENTVLYAPVFALEVEESKVSDTPAETTPQFSALEAMVAKAQMAYDTRLLSIELRDDLTFVASFADGSVYESDALVCLKKAGEKMDEALREYESMKEQFDSSIQSALESQRQAAQSAEASLKSATDAEVSAGNAGESAARAEESAKKAQAVAQLEIDTVLDTNSYNPIANKAVAEAFENVDAKTLDGHEAEYFAPLSLLTAQKMPNGTDLNDCIEVGVYYFDSYATNYVNTPSNTAHNGIMVVRERGWTRVVQEYTSINTGITYTRTGSSTWTEWKEITTASALATELAKYLPLTGGTVDGNVDQIVTASTFVRHKLKNPVRNIDHVIYASGDYVQFDNTNNKAIYTSKADGTNTFNGTASGNLPLDGGTLRRTARRILTVDNIHESGSGSAIGFSVNGTFLGEIGILKNGTLVFNNSVVEYGLLHTGNSAKVHIGTSAPSDTSSLWIDTSA